VFLDKDGTLIDDIPFNVNPSLIRLATGASVGLARLHLAGYRLVVVSNQSGVAHGYFPEEDLRPVANRLRELLDDAGAPLTGFYYCPHHPQGRIERLSMICGCRKPAAGMLLQASGELNIDLQRSWLIGDILDDIEAGRRAGCRMVLIVNGNETEWRERPLRQPNFVASDLAIAADLILHDRGARL